VPAIYRKLATINEVGLGYIKLGQPATTFSGGEAQRIKLASELARRSTGKTLYILDEPTTGLHTADVKKLLEILQKLVEGGNSMIIIEHNLEVIKCADHIIDMGPEGGQGGGMVIASGTPEEITKVPASFTGKYLKELL
jgi:excinuclease ABC subunit A